MMLDSGTFCLCLLRFGQIYVTLNGRITTLPGDNVGSNYKNFVQTGVQWLFYDKILEDIVKP